MIKRVGTLAEDRYVTKRFVRTGNRVEDDARIYELRVEWVETKRKVYEKKQRDKKREAKDREKENLPPIEKPPKK